MMTAGRPRRWRTAAAAIVVFAVFMHGVAIAMVARFADLRELDKTTLVVITGSAALSWSLMLSQAMESVTRAFYARADLDLILTSPTLARRVFAVRIAIIGVSVAAMAMLLAAPFINVLAVAGGLRWLSAYGVVAAMGGAAAALAVGLTVALFRTIGPRRTRFVAQIVAAVIGAAFVIGIQIAAILSYGTISRVSFLSSNAVVARAPELDSFIWWPARAIIGDGAALAAVLATGLVLLIGSILMFAPRFGEHAVAAAGLAPPVSRARRAQAFRPAVPRRALRRKEWTLLLRDPWLASQTLMQILYLVPRCCCGAPLRTAPAPSCCWCLCW